MQVILLFLSYYNIFSRRSRTSADIICLFLLLTGCENVRQSIGISTNPFSNKFEEKTKVNYKIIFGKVRPKEDDDD